MFNEPFQQGLVTGFIFCAVLVGLNSLYRQWLQTRRWSAYARKQVQQIDLELADLTNQDPWNHVELSAKHRDLLDDLRNWNRRLYELSKGKEGFK